MMVDMHLYYLLAELARVVHRLKIDEPEIKKIEEQLEKAGFEFNE